MNISLLNEDSTYFTESFNKLQKDLASDEFRLEKLLGLNEKTISDPGCISQVLQGKLKPSYLQIYF